VGVPWWRSWPALTAAAVTVLVLGVLGFAGSGGGDGAGGDGPLYVAERGSLTIHVTESGTIQAREQVVLKSEVEGQTTIIWLIEEGKHVKEGDLLVELDASQLEDELVDQQIRVQNADAAFVRARENLEITRSKGESDVAQAELDFEFAKEDLKKYVEGEYPKELDEMEARIKLAEGDLEDAQNTAEWSKKLYEEKYIAETNLTSDELRRDRAELDLKTAIANRDLLVNYTYKRRVRELESDVEQREMASDRVRRQALANVVQEEADLTAKRSELKRQKERLTKIEDQLNKTKIYSPAAGMVVYATTGRDDRRGRDEPLEAGRVVREREELIHLPTANAKLVNIKVHESSLKKVRVGQLVRITINALPGREYLGTVARIAPLPDAQSFWRGNPDLKVYNTEIHLDGELEGVRTGMTCKAQVIIDQLEDVISIPVQSVVKIGSQPTVYVKRGSRAVPVPVEVGLDNKDRVHIVSGIKAGDRVLTNPPLQDTDAKDDRAQNGKAPEAGDAAQRPQGQKKPGAGRPQGADGQARQARPEGDAGQPRQGNPDAAKPQAPAKPATESPQK
jgi:HlyD family secretion protein